MNDKIKLTDFGVYVMVDDTHLSRWVEQDRRLDHAHKYLERFRPYIPLNGTVIDAGTSIGDHTVTYASMVGPEGRVIGFEANPDVAECCALNLAIYPWATIYNVGLAEAYGVAGIVVSPNVGASHLINEGREVKLEPLDAYLDRVDRCDFIKVDIEGFELRFLNGAREFLGRYKPAILMEINLGALEKQGTSQNEVLKRLESMGYEWNPVDEVHGSEQYDIFAVKKN
jgi:FkbM family methyltransferase